MSAPFDDPQLLAAMRSYLAAFTALETGADGEARAVLDLAEAKAVAGMALRTRLEAAGWSAPVAQRSTT